MFFDDIFRILISKVLVSIKKPFSAAFGIENCLSCRKGLWIDQDESLFNI